VKDSHLLIITKVGDKLIEVARQILQDTASEIASKDFQL